VDLTDRNRSREDFLAWVAAEGEPGFGEGWLNLAYPGDSFRQWFRLSEADPFSGPADIAEAGLYARLPIYRDGDSIEPDTILRSHVVACQFIDRDPAELFDLEPEPTVVVALGDRSYALWGLWEPIDGAELQERQEFARDTLGGDPGWLALPGSLIPVPGVLYEDIDGEEVEAIELERVAS
jgi:hypothetical protein